jgi:hypothetical protein
MSSSRSLGFAFGIAIASALTVRANAAEDLSTLQVTPQRGQSADQARRDRYECHNWAVEQTGETPIAAPVRERDEPNREERAKRAERVGRVINGAVIGAGLGGLVRATQDKDPSNGILAGAAAGAAVGAAIGRDNEREEEAEVAAPSDYLRALTACMEGRGYTVALPGVAEAVARR